MSYLVPGTIVQGDWYGGPGNINQDPTSYAGYQGSHFNAVEAVDTQLQPFEFRALEEDDDAFTELSRQNIPQQNLPFQFHAFTVDTSTDALIVDAILVVAGVIAGVLVATQTKWLSY